MASTTMVQPMARRTRCSILRRRTMATPIPTTTTGRAKRPRPNNQPNVVSIASPRGPAIWRYIDNTNKMPMLMRPTPQNSTSRPRTTSRAAESGAAAGRLLPFGGVLTELREPADFLDPCDDGREPLADIKKQYQRRVRGFGIPRYKWLFRALQTISGGHDHWHDHGATLGAVAHKLSSGFSHYSLETVDV